MTNRHSTNGRFRINEEQLSYATGPFAYEFVPSRAIGKWRLHDAKDNAVGSAEDEAAAVQAVRVLNGDTLH
ncbi:hypothetical protein PQH03_27950 [Ralstonia insidiosa]|uniref:DUF2188 domain-containing protein n=1 Tax=Ralstonia insidiosa TaxID=190721 RepID=A0A192A7D0_9RALS|nr:MULTISPECIES: hypothetical protein [Ralstonia]KMW44844.1 hypothetical protein AC240_23060 [Ralstonia sp. MD27]ANJ76294.1 hypothetical protein A9Y76_27200 [Ralstonia insidiosa]MCK8653173.1 hypothetical protein [Ralstonia insidiosa]MDE4928481.1 hypothetical protein [Ralstonia insidiosa]UNK04081.1 hypothetical protein MMB19_29935 [Ralstonia insidiosa]